MEDLSLFLDIGDLIAIGSVFTASRINLVGRPGQ
jgi:hypothetical protein